MIILKKHVKEISLQTFKKKPYAIERILAAATYLTAGGVGFVWWIIAILTKKRITQFLIYHIMQSIFVSMAFFLLSALGKMLFMILYRIPLINTIPYLINMPLPLVFGFSILQLLTTTIVLYLTITSGLGYYSYLPWVSDIINGNSGRK